MSVSAENALRMGSERRRFVGLAALCVAATESLRGRQMGSREQLDA